MVFADQLVEDDGYLSFIPDVKWLGLAGGRHQVSDFKIMLVEVLVLRLRRWHHISRFEWQLFWHYNRQEYFFLLFCIDI